MSYHDDPRFTLVIRIMRTLPPTDWDTVRAASRFAEDLAGDGPDADAAAVELLHASIRGRLDGADRSAEALALADEARRELKCTF